jgi:hypothetical protein
MFYKGILIMDASAVATAQICAFTMLLLQAVGDEKAAVWIGFDRIIFI